MIKIVSINDSQQIKPKKNTNIGLSSLLEEKGLTQADLARLVSVDRAYICRILHGLERPPVPMMIKIAKALGVDSRIVFSEKSTDKC